MNSSGGSSVIDGMHALANLQPEHPVFSNFPVKSPSGKNYQVEIRGFKARIFSCTRPDFRTADLGTCKHVQATLTWPRRRSSKIRISQDLENLLESRRRVEERVTLRRNFEPGVVEGRHPKSQRLQRSGELRALAAEKQEVARLFIAADLAERSGAPSKSG